MASSSDLWGPALRAMRDMGFSTHALPDDWQLHPLFVQWTSSATHTSPVVVNVFDVATLQFLFVSEHAERLLGHTATDLIRGGFNYLSAHTDPTWAAPLARIVADYAQLFMQLTVEQRRVATASYVRRFRRKDGHYIILLMQSTPLYLDPVTHALRLNLVMFTDITAFYTTPFPTGVVSYPALDAEGRLDSTRLVEQRLPLDLGRSETRLSPREHQVLRLAAEGLSSRQIAERLGISLLTVNTHRTNMLQKTGSRNLTELAVLLAQKGQL